MRKTFALFDFDGTLIPGDSLVLFCLFAKKQGLCTTQQLRAGALAALKYRLGLFTAEQSKMAALAFLIGKTQAELDALALSFFESELKPRMRQAGLQAIEQHKNQGDTLLLVTASPSFYLEPLRQAYGFAAIIGTRMDLGMDGVATGLICGENCRGLQKSLRLAEYLAATGDRLDYESSYAYGDSLSDLPLLELCGHKVAVNPGPLLKRKLRRLEGAGCVRWNR